MSGYHSFELCYLAAVYTNLLITKQPLTLHFKPKPGGFKDNVLRVAPDILPKGAIMIESVTVNGQDYADFDADALTVKIPDSKEPVQIVVRVAPTQGLEHFSARLQIEKGVATLVLTGDLESRALPFFRQKLEEVVAAQPKQLRINMMDLKDMTSAASGALIFAKQKLETNEDVVVIGANKAVNDLLSQTEFAESVSFA
jgi:anti-anti-sigma factor